MKVLLLTPTSHPSPLLLSMTMNLALDSTYLPKLTTPPDVEDIPAFSDDWDLATRLYPHNSYPKVPVSLPIVSVGENVFLDPSVAEVTASEAGLVVTVTVNGEGEGEGGQVTGVRGREVGMAGTGNDKTKKGMSRKLLKTMVQECRTAGAEMVKELHKTVNDQLGKEGRIIK